MQRFHKSIYFPENLKEKLSYTNEKLNRLNYKYTTHCLCNINENGRIIDLTNLLEYIKALQLKFEDIFEFYYNESISEIEKVCYRIKYLSDIDLILILSGNKTIITIYLNSADDLHYTLKSELYTNNKGKYEKI